MGWWGNMKDRAVGRAYARYRRALENLAPAQLSREADAQLLAAFRRAAREVPAYGQILAAAGVAPQEVATVEQFCNRVPILDKQSVFTEGRRLRDLCVGGALDDVSLFYTSSGHSGVFSFGVERRGAERQAALGIEFLFDALFDIRRRRTVLVNCLPLDVRIPTRTLALAEAGVRADAVLELIRKLTGEFEQFILVGESLFLKQVADEGAAAGIRWGDLRVNVVTGGEFIPETYRSYLADTLQLRPDGAGGRIFLNMGLSELSISIFHEEPETVEIRRAALTDAHFREALAGGPTAVCPEVMQYDPRHAYVECCAGQAGPPELVISILDRDRALPLLRYRTGDRGRTLSHAALLDLLRQFGYERLTPRLRLPVAVLWGRESAVRLASGQAVSVSEVKEALYEDIATARQLTGRFHISPDGPAARLDVQLRPLASPSTAAAQRLAEAVGQRTACPVDVRLLEYHSLEYDRTYDYQRKPQYVSRAAASASASSRETASKETKENRP